MPDINNVYTLIKKDVQIPLQERRVINSKIEEIHRLPQAQRIKKADKFIRFLIVTYWPIDSYKYFINLSLKSLWNINTFIITTCTCVIKYSKFTKRFLWQLATELL